jgi:putative tryptophan/tyrosine transport system substrate-binding protein
MNRSKQAGMAIKPIIILLVGLTLTSVRLADVQQTKKVARIGVLSQSSANFLSSQLEAFRQGLRDFGYVEGQNIAIEYRYAEGKLERLPGLTVELVRLKVDVIAATSTPGFWPCGFTCGAIEEVGIDY